MSSARVRDWPGRGLRLQFTLSLVVFGLFLASAGDPGIARGGEKKERVSGIAQTDYEKLFLDANDLPGWRKGQDSKDMGADPGDKAFTKLGGLHSGLVVWTAKKEPFQRMVDIRWVFPSAAAAKAYLKERLPYLSENMPEVKTAPKIGDDSHAFGSDQDVFGMKSRSYILVFRQGNVVIKFFQYESGAAAELSPLAMSAQCLKILKRIKSVGR